MCEFEAKRKLLMWGLDTSQQSRIVSELVQDRYIDNQRFAIAFTRDKSRFDRWGKEKIKHALQTRRISSDIISIALEEILEETETSNLEKLLFRKHQSYKPTLNAQDKRNKLIRFGLSRGYEMGLVLEMIKRIPLK
jgi:regulatory protein